MIQTLRYYFRLAKFAVFEEFSNIPAGLSRFILYPVYIWVPSSMWIKFNNGPNHLSASELIQYVGLAQVMQLTLFPTSASQIATGEFTLSLARPRSWLMSHAVQSLGKGLASRFIMLPVYIFMCFALNSSATQAFKNAIHFLPCMLLVSLVDLQWSLLFSNSILLWHNVTYFRMPVNKLFLIFGGVIGPLSELSEPWKSLFIATPFADFIFQPTYYSLKGHFYQMQPAQWVMRIFTQFVVMGILNIILFRVARKNHLSYGG